MLAVASGIDRLAGACLIIFLAINGAQLTAGLDETLNFVSSLYEAGTFDFDRLNDCRAAVNELLRLAELEPAMRQEVKLKDCSSEVEAALAGRGRQ